MGRMESGAAASNVGGSAMMHSAVGKSMIVAAAMVTCFAAAYAQDPTNSIEGYYPTQLNRGQTTTLNVAFNVGRGGGPIAVQLFEIAPPDGITVGTLKGEEARVPIAPRIDEQGEVPVVYRIDSNIGEAGASQLTKLWRY